MYHYDNDEMFGSITEVKMSPKRKVNKFYVGAEHIAAAIDSGTNADWTHATEEKAIAHARKIVENEDKELVVVVKIIAIVKREKTPIKVVRV